MADKRERRHTPEREKAIKGRPKKTPVLAAALCTALALAAGPAGAAAPDFAEARNYGVGGDPTSVAAADFDGDRRPDLAVDSFTNARVSVLANRGNGVFGKAAGYRVGRYPTSVVAADLSGNGRPPRGGEFGPRHCLRPHQRHEGRTPGALMVGGRLARLRVRAKLGYRMRGKCSA